MFQNGQHTLLQWHNIQALVPNSFAQNGTSSYENYLKKFWGRTPRPPSITTVLDTIILWYSKIHLHIHYMHMHITVLYKFAKIFTNYMENPVLPPFLRNIPNPPPPPAFSLIPNHQLFFLFPNFGADENKYFGIEIPENKFSGRAHAENNMSW